MSDALLKLDRDDQQSISLNTSALRDIFQYAKPLGHHEERDNLNLGFGFVYDGLVRALTSSGAVDVVAEADDGVAAFALIKTHLPHVALLDYRMPGMDGAKVAAAVRRDDLPTRVLLLSAHDESAIVFHALAEGAAGFLPKESTKTEIVKAVLDCAKGRDVVSPTMAAGLAGEIRRRAEAETPALSPREREVLNFIAQGYSIPTIAAELYLAPSTVKTHVQRLYEKLGVSDRAAAVAAAMRRGLLE